MHRNQSNCRIILVIFTFCLAAACQSVSLSRTASRNDNPISHSSGTSSMAGVEWAVQETLNVDEAPLDVQISPDRRWIFVLTDRGNVLVYSENGDLQGRISVGRDVSGIRVGPEDETILLINRDNKTVQLIDIEFVRSIDVTGSPFKGPPDAPVVMIVFSDFQ